MLSEYILCPSPLEGYKGNRWAVRSVWPCMPCAEGSTKYRVRGNITNRSLSLFQYVHFFFFGDAKRKSEPKKKNTQKFPASLRTAGSNWSSWRQSLQTYMLAIVLAHTLAWKPSGTYVPPSAQGIQGRKTRYLVCSLCIPHWGEG